MIELLIGAMGGMVITLIAGVFLQRKKFITIPFKDTMELVVLINRASGNPAEFVTVYVGKYGETHFIHSRDTRGSVVALLNSALQKIDREWEEPTEPDEKLCEKPGTGTTKGSA